MKKLIFVFGLVMIRGLSLIGISDGQATDEKLVDLIQIPAGNTTEDNGNITLNYDIMMGKYEVPMLNILNFLTKQE